MTDNPVFRDAVATDSPTIAQLMIEAGEGLYEYLFDDLEPGQNAQAVLTQIVETDKGPLNWKNCRVGVKHNIVTKNDDVVGMVNAFACDRLKHLVPDWVPADRQSHLSSLFRHIESSDAMLLNAMAVIPAQRGAGIGVRLIAEALGMAGSQGKKLLIARLWATNTRTRKLYEDFGFSLIDFVELPPVNRLSGRRALYMERKV